MSSRTTKTGVPTPVIFKMFSIKNSVILACLSLMVMGCNNYSTPHQYKMALKYSVADKCEVYVGESNFDIKSYNKCIKTADREVTAILRGER